MALITKSTKQGGTTELQAGQSAVPEDINTDMNTVFNLANGNIDNANISAGAAIAYSKLNLSGAIQSADIAAGAIVDSDINASADITQTKIGDISATDAAHDDTTTPGDSSSHTLPTTLSGELQQLRYAVERIALGVGAVRYDATGTEEYTFWGDRPARNMVWLPGFNGVVTSGLPSGWSNVATATLAQEAADAADATAGKGRAIKITAAGSANEGMSYTLSGLKASTRYLIVAIAKATSGDTAKLTTTGADATSSFRNITATTTATAWTPLYGVIQTDATPTNIVINCLAAADTDIVWFAHVGYAECAATPLAPRVAVPAFMEATTAGTVITGATTDAGLDTNYQFIDNGSTDLDLTVYVPGDGYYIRARGVACAEADSSGSNNVSFSPRLYMGVNGGALSAVRNAGEYRRGGGNNNIERFSIPLEHLVLAPTPGASYRFALAATAGGSPSVAPQKTAGSGHSTLIVEVLPYG